MTSVQTYHSASHSNSGYNFDTNLDALLNDLQSGVGPRGEHTLVNGSSVHLPPGSTGYRETTTTVTQERNGVPTTSRDYQIEYLNPANSVTVVSERANSPLPDNAMRGPGFLEGTPGQQVASYKKSSYEYKVSQKTTDQYGNPIKPDANYSMSKSETSRETNAGNTGRNINELDVLLQELNTPNPPRRTEHSSRSIETRVQRDYPQTSTPRSASLTRDAQNQYHQYGEIQHGTPRSGHREFTETPGTPKAPQRSVNVHREVNTIEQRSHTAHREPGSPILRRRTPSPGGEFRPATFSSYPHSPAETRRSRSRTRFDDSHVSSHVTSSTTSNESKYRTNYTNHTSTTRSDDPLPYRSPSPVSFPQHRSPSPQRRVVTHTDTARSLTRSDSGRGLTRSDSANRDKGYPAKYLDGQPPLSDPSSPTVITYKYSSHSREHSQYPGGWQETSAHDGPRPFPTNTPYADPGQQSPPKKLDELMASFNDTSNHRSYSSNTERTERSDRTDRYYREIDSQQRQQDLQRSPSFEKNLRPSTVKATQVYNHPMAPAPVTEVVPVPSTPQPQNRQLQQQQLQQQQAARSVAGPPVYYPPGVELFAKKEEAMMEQQNSSGKGWKKGKGKMEYKYEASEKSKEKSGTRTTVVPACLPLCCAMPCVIM